MAFQRNIQFKLEQALSRNPVTLLLGARQTGKTTAMRALALSRNYNYVSLDDLRHLTEAKSDPMGFIQRIPKPVIIDEVQRAPDLFLSIKHFVDQPEQRINGLFVLTGSANPFFIPEVGDSLAGRIEVLTLYPLSQGEIENVHETFIDTVFKDGQMPSIKFKPLSREKLFNKILVGGYPLAQNKSWDDTYNWFDNYLNTLIQKDISDLTRLENSSVIPRLLRAFVARSGQLLNIAELGIKSKIPSTSVNRYIKLLETLFLIYQLDSWHTTIARRALKAPKAYLIDSGLLGYLKSETLEKVLQDPQEMGHVLENFIVSELKKQQTWCQDRVSLHHFRTASQIEVDVVLERSDGQIVGIEVKSNSHVDRHDIKGLECLRAETGSSWHRGIVLYTGNEIFPLSDTITALPINALWSYTKK